MGVNEGCNREHDTRRTRKFSRRYRTVACDGRQEFLCESRLVAIGKPRIRERLLRAPSGRELYTHMQLLRLVESLTANPPRF